MPYVPLHNNKSNDPYDELHDLAIKTYSAVKRNNVDINEIRNVLLDLIDEQEAINYKINIFVVCFCIAVIVFAFGIFVL